MEIIALGIVGVLVLMALWAKATQCQTYDHRKDSRTDLVAHKVAKWFHPEAAELLDRELVGRDIVSSQRARGTDFAQVFDGIADQTRAEIQRITGGR